MQKTTLLVAVLGALSAMPAFAADAPASAFTPSANVSIVNNYLYRGITQSGNRPAMQGGFDLGHSSGAYIGVWGSSISWLESKATNSGAEFDTYLGYKGEAAGMGYDVGFLRYNYPGYAAADTNEYYLALSYSIVTAKVSYASTNLFGTTNSKGSTYLELNASYPIGDIGIALGAHYGKQAVTNNPSSEYTDYKVSVSKDFSGYGLGLAYSHESLTPSSSTVLSLSRAF